MNEEYYAGGFFDCEALSEELEQESLRYSRRLSEEEEAA